jgi:signal peptidase I
MSATKKSGNTIKSELSSLAIVILFALSIKAFVFDIFFIPTGSMKATILENDYIFSTKYDYGYSTYSIPFVSVDLFKGKFMTSEPKRGDIVIMKPPPPIRDDRYIKRLIGLPGEKIEIKNDVTYINDVAVDRVHVGIYTDKNGQEFEKFKETLPNGLSFFSYKMKTNMFDYAHYKNRNSYGPHLVEEGHYFFLGDNRDNSGDSRYQLGTVPARNLIAKGRFIIFSTKEFFWDYKKTILQQLSENGIWNQIVRIKTWFLSIRTDRLFKNLYDIETNNDQ